MRYSVFFLATTDDTIRLGRPRLANIGIKSNLVNIEMAGKIPFEQITSVSVQHDVTEKTLSAGKALGGAIIAGPLGALLGAAMGGKKVTSLLTIDYTGSDGQSKQVVFDTKLANVIKNKIDDKMQKFEVSQKAPQPTTKANSLSSLTLPGLLRNRFKSRNNNDES